jgi:spore germination cell wall hydrolase CwlJ-like protein
MTRLYTYLAGTITGIILNWCMLVYAPAVGDAIEDVFDKPEPVKIVINTAPPNLIDYRQVECLAKNIYFEARNEPIEGQIAVAQVVLNRIRHDKFPDNVCDVIYQGPVRYQETEQGTVPLPLRNRCQFSWYCDGRSDEPANMAAWGEAVTVAAGVIRGDYEDLSKGALWYHSKKITPNWRGVHFVTAIGGHRFYTSN